MKPKQLSRVVNSVIADGKNREGVCDLLRERSNRGEVLNILGEMQHEQFRDADDRIGTRWS